MKNLKSCNHEGHEGHEESEQIFFAADERG